MVRSTRKTNVRHRLGIHINLSEERYERWRNVFIQQQAHHVLGPRRKASRFRGRPGLSPSRENSRA